MLKKGKEEIAYLLSQCIQKFQQETSQEIVLNTNRKNYEALARRLSDISNQLPFTSQEFGHQPYEQETAQHNQQYPFRKYDITGGQIKDALMGLVSNPRSYLVDTCYIYLYGKGRLAFEANPADAYLVQADGPDAEGPSSLSLYHENQQLRMQLAMLRSGGAQQAKHGKLRFWLKYGNLIGLAAAVLALVLIGVPWLLYQRHTGHWQTLKTDFNLLPYEVSAAERQKLEGVWICYTGSPQARLSDTNRYHKVVANIVEITYKDGYFIYNRFGASFNHIGYAQFEAPGLLSIHSRVITEGASVESPRHSLLTLDSTGPYLTAISASWNFDVGSSNRMIGIREAYKKLGKGGKLTEVINSVENASCQCKIIRWQKADNAVETFYLRNTSLEGIRDSALLPLIDERSILPKDPKDKLLISPH